MRPFFDEFNSATESEKFAICAEFAAATGGKMSPYNNPTPVAVAVVATDIGYVGIRRKIEPRIGGIAFPGGFVDAGESAEEAAKREFFEETGLKLFCDFKISHSVITPRNEMLIFCVYQGSSVKELPVASNAEVVEVVEITSETKLAFPLHQEFKDAMFKD